ncbi:GAF domain-containing sensor histidine kinase [Radiobacillus kanasensis]|uniref:GAF domain-containing sensor histidine kinase n=1 Tax=Radiobacillus kanasensis TaxID=2844358 RepID=UPI001E56F19A|nr:GAF domain-containing sensor histidine kinase [Radiobacillus kanasensis]UFU00406.1 GAF domain-containing sensor histidine kinase [Radiobacillus kanasensis]
MIDETRRLKTLKTIAELLNQSTNKSDMVHEVLRQLIEITHFEAGWFFLEEDQHVKYAASHQLPAALSHRQYEPMCSEDCYCISRYKRGALTKATSIIGCKRLEKARQEGRTDTNGISHHATVPLRTNKRSYGLLNVASPNQTTYNEQELDLLEGLALQIGTALERIERFEEEEKRVAQLTHLHTVIQELQKARTRKELLKALETQLFLMLPHIQIHWTKPQEAEYLEGEFGASQKVWIVRESAFTQIEKEVFTLFMEYVDVIYLHIQLEEKEREIVKGQERSKLAQDLHDSVNQLLFSVALTSKATLMQVEDEKIKEQVEYVHQLASQALTEMREVVANQRPQALEKGLVHALVKYGKGIGIDIECETVGTSSIPYIVEETLWRVGQEAIHNINKHADVKEARIYMARKEAAVRLHIIDEGRGMSLDHAYQLSFGLQGMKDRIEMLGGSMQLESKIGEGTTINVYIPLEEQS